MEKTMLSEMEGRKQMDAQDQKHEAESFDPWENFRQELTHKRVIQDWE